MFNCDAIVARALCQSTFDAFDWMMCYKVWISVPRNPTITVRFTVVALFWSFIDDHHHLPPALLNRP